MTKALESTFQTGMLKLLNTYGCLARNIHGNMYTCGVPDITVTSKFGVTFFVELKMWRNVHAPADVDALFRLLRKTQRPFIRGIWERNGYCPIAACTMDGKNVFYTTKGQSVLMTYPDILCKIFSELTHEAV